MSWYAHQPAPPAFHRLIKVDLHRHLEGSLRLETMMDIVRLYSITLPLRPDLRSLVQVQPGDALTAANFLSKFQFLRLMYRSPEVIARVTREAIQDAANDGVIYMDLHFTPAALGRYQSLSLSEVMDCVVESARRAANDFGIQVNLIASINRHESLELAEEVARLAADRREEGVVGLDLAGNESEYPAAPFVEVFREARAAGLALVIHAGEWGGAANVRQAIEEIRADRVVHGVRVMEDPGVAALARAAGTPFAVCPTSNHQSGVSPSLEAHPLKQMIAAGINVTLNTDDPGISQITLTDEYHVAVTRAGITPTDLAGCILAAGRAAFLPTAEKQVLMARLEVGLRALL